MENLQTFTNSEFGSVRTISENGKILFCGSDITKSLGYSNTIDALHRHCRYVVKHDIPHPQSKSKTIEVNFIPEGDVYRLVAGSELPSAERFESWVFDEVLPQIRLTGGYIPMQDEDSDAMIMARAIKIADKSIQEKNKIIAELTPKAEAFDTYLNAKGYLSFNKVAKSLGVGRNTMLKILRQRGMLFRDGFENIPYQKFVDAGHFVVKQVVGYDGRVHTSTRVLPKGVERIRKELNRSRQNTNHSEVA